MVLVLVVAVVEQPASNVIVMINAHIIPKVRRVIFFKFCLLHSKWTSVAQIENDDTYLAGSIFGTYLNLLHT